MWSRGTLTIVLFSSLIITSIDRMDRLSYIRLILCVWCSETVSNSFEVRQIHSGVQNHSTAPIKLMNKLEIRSRCELFVYTNNKNLFEPYLSRRDRETSRIPVKKSKATVLSKKNRKLKAFVFYQIRKRESILGVVVCKLILSVFSGGDSLFFIFTFFCFSDVYTNVAM